MKIDNIETNELLEMYKKIQDFLDFLGKQEKEYNKEK